MSERRILDFIKEKERILSGGSEKDENDKGIEPMNLVLGDYHAPEELKLRTLGAMDKMQRDRERKRNRAMRTAAAIAILTATVAFTPLSSCVRNVAESAYDAMRSWFTHTTHQGYKKYSQGCEIELIETTLVNDFLYVTMDEDYDDYLERYRWRNVNVNEQGEEDPEGDFVETVPDGITEFDHEMVLSLSGEIFDSDGNSIPFTSEYVTLEDIGVGTDQAYNQNAELEQRVHTYRVWLPELSKLITSRRKQYSFSLRLDLHDHCKSRNTDDYISTFYYQHLPIEDVGSVLNKKEYAMNQSVTMKNVKYDFTKLTVGQSESNLLVEVTPLGKLAEEMTRDIVHNEYSVKSDYFYNLMKVYKETPEIKSNYEWFAKKNNIDEIGGKKTILFEGNETMKISGRYYLILTYSANNAGDYRYADVVEEKKGAENIFRIWDMLYSYGNAEPVVDENGEPVWEDPEEVLIPSQAYKTLYWEMWENRMAVVDQVNPYGIEAKTATQIKSYCVPVDESKMTEQEKNDRQLFLEDFDAPEWYNPLYTFRAGSLTFNAMMDSCFVYLTDIYDETGVNWSFGDGQVNRSLWVEDMAFVVEKDGKAVYYRYNYNNRTHSTTVEMPVGYEDVSISEDGKMTADCCLAYLRYCVKEDGKNVHHVLYDPRYYNEKGESNLYLEEVAAAKEFCKHNTLTVGKKLG